MQRIFYSWQADREAKTGRHLVRRALEEAIKMLMVEADADVEEAKRDQESIALDSDTQGVTGSPPIVDTIFKKIDSASVFVADLTFVGERCSGKLTPNPNVAIEYGYALKTLSHARIVGVMNEVHGKPTRESLPFDLGHMRFPITYSCPDDADDATRRKARSALATQLKYALKAILDNAELRSEKETRPLYASAYPNADMSRFRTEAEPIGQLHDGSMIARPDAPQIGIASGPAMWLRVMPKYAPANDLLTTRIREGLVNSGYVVAPLHAEEELNMLGIRGDDGYGFAASTAYGEDASILIYVLKRGEVWSIDAARMSYQPGNVFFNPDSYVRALSRFGDLLKRLDVAGPYKWIAGIAGMAGTRIHIEGRHSPFGSQVCLEKSVILTGDYSGDPEQAAISIEPFIARVYDAAHLQR